MLAWTVEPLLGLYCPCTGHLLRHISEHANLIRAEHGTQRQCTSAPAARVNCRNVVLWMPPGCPGWCGAAFTCPEGHSTLEPPAEGASASRTSRLWTPNGFQRQLPVDTCIQVGRKPRVLADGACHLPHLFVPDPNRTNLRWHRCDITEHCVDWNPPEGTNLSSAEHPS